MKARKRRGVAHADPQKADLRASAFAPIGSALNVPDRAALDLAIAIHYHETDDRSIDASWTAQERAEAFYNEHGLAATLDEARRLQAQPHPGRKARR